jgi:hypothetical protein
MAGGSGAADTTVDRGLAPAGAVRTRTVTPVCDPELPLSFRSWVTGQRPVFNARGKLSALTPGGRSVRLPAVAVCWLLTAICTILLFTGSAAVSPAVWLAGACTAAMAAVATQQRARRSDLRLCRSNVIFPENLDGTCRELLLRSQQAITAVSSSRVRAAGILERAVPDEMLRQHQWEIACQLREITSLRTLLADSSPGTAVGPMTTGVLAAQQRAIDLAHHAADARIAALEHYAQQIAAADDADRDWCQAIELSKLNHRYLDLVARTASDEHAANEITGLTEQLAVATRARSDRLREADLAAEVLVLPAAVPD